MNNAEVDWANVKSLPTNEPETAVALPRAPVAAFRLVWWAAAAGILLSAASALWFHFEANRLDRERFNQKAWILGSAVDAYVGRIADLVRALARELSRERGANRLLWDEFSNQSNPQWDFPGLLAMGYATNHQAGSIMQYLEPWLRDQDPLPRDKLFQLDLASAPGTTSYWSTAILDVYWNALTPAIPAQSYSNVLSTREKRLLRIHYDGMNDRPSFASPNYSWHEEHLLEKNLAVPVVADAVIRDELKVQATPISFLRPQPPLQRQIALIAPVHLPDRKAVFPVLRGGGPDTNNAVRFIHWHLNQGVVFALVDLGMILTNLGAASSSQDVNVELYSWDGLGPPAITSEHWVNPNQSGMKAANDNHKSGFSLLLKQPSYGKEWIAYFYSTPRFLAESTHYRSWVAGFGGLILTGSVCGVLAIQVRSGLRESRRSADLREARDSLRAAQAERERLSQDLHDGTIQSLYAIQLGLTETGRVLDAQIPTAARRLEEARVQLDAVIGEVRSYIQSSSRANRACEKHATLQRVLAALVRRFQPASSARIELNCPAHFPALDDTISVELASIAGEALSNAVRHAEAKNITLGLGVFECDLTLEICDDGKGFDPALVTLGLGLVSIRRRAKHIGASIEIDSVPGHGCTVRTKLNLAAREAANHDHAQT